MSSKFKRIKKNGGVKGLIKRVKTSGTVDAGIIDAGKHPSGDMTVAEIGFANEFGTNIIPERPFMRSTLRLKKILSLKRKLLKRIVTGKLKTNRALGLLGLFVADEIRKRIVAIRTPPNALRTIQEKGSSNPLVDSGQLKNSITHEVNR